MPVVYATAWASLTATARCARASACSSTAPPAVWASPCCSWPSAAARRSTARRRPPSTTPARARPRPRDRLPHRRLVARPAQLRSGRRRHRRRVVQALQRAAAPRRAPGRARRLLGPGGREAQPAPRAAAGAAMMRGFDLIKQLSESKAVVGINMKRLWDDRGTLAPWIEPLTALPRRRHHRAGRPRGGPVRPRAARRIASSPRGRTWGRSSSCRRRARRPSPRARRRARDEEPQTPSRPWPQRPRAAGAAPTARSPARRPRRR